MNHMRTPRGQAVRKWTVILACLLSWMAAPRGAGAQELEIETDARLEGYSDKVMLEPSNNAMTWAAFMFCAVIAVLGLFKDARRTHLD